MTSHHSDIEALASQHQQTLLVQIERFFGRNRIPKPIRRAYLNTPRHHFVPRFYSSRKGDWIELTSKNTADHLTELYADHPLAIYRNAAGKTVSTISQPSLVLYMLGMLQVQPGMSVFELGCGSGWNAAMLGKLVGQDGKVVSVEIIEDLAQAAAKTIAEKALHQVEIIAGDGNESLSNTATFQRGIFTASAWDLPEIFFQQIEADGLLLFVVKLYPGLDLLTLLKKTAPNRFESHEHFRCTFVPVTGSHIVPDTQQQKLAELPALSPQGEYNWFDLKVDPEEIEPLVDFLRIVFDCQTAYLLETSGQDYDEEFYGFESPDQQSRLLFNEDRILAYGTEDSLIAFRRSIKRWKKAGQPRLEDLDLSIHRIDETITPTNDQWLVTRRETQLLWSLPAK